MWIHNREDNMRTSILIYDYPLYAWNGTAVAPTGDEVQLVAVEQPCGGWALKKLISGNLTDDDFGICNLQDCYEMVHSQDVWT